MQEKNYKCESEKRHGVRKVVKNESSKTAAPILKSGSKKLTVRIKKVSGCKGYEIRCALDRKLKKAAKPGLPASSLLSFGD